MAQKLQFPAQYLVHRQGAMESLITQGLKALDSSPYQAEWQQLLDRLEVLILNAPPNPKLANESNNGDSAFPVEAMTEDNAPTRILRETVSYLRTKDSISPATRDVELSKYKSLVSQLDKHCRKSILSTATSSSSPPTIASDKGSTSSLSAPAWEQDLPSPSPLKFTFTRTSTNSFAVDVCPDEPLPETLMSLASTQSTPTQIPTPARHDAQVDFARRARSESASKPIPKARSRSTSVRETPYSSLHGIAIDENAVHNSGELPLKVKVPLNLTRPPINKPSKHRHSRSLPALRPESKQLPLPPLPQIPQSPGKSLRHFHSSNEFVGQNHLFLGGGVIPTAKSSKRPIQKVTREPVSQDSEDQNRWTIHDRDSWEIVPPSTPSKSPYHSTSQSALQEEPSSLPETKPKGLDRLRSRFPKSQLYIKTGSLSSIANLGSPGRIGPVPVNVNAVVMGPVGCGVSTLIQKFITGSNDWVPSSTIDDFWHHVVQTESRTTYYNLTEVTGAEEYADLRRAVLRRAQVVLLCFRLDSRLQFRDTIVRLVEDIHTIGEIPIVLVGTFQDSPDREVSSDEAQTAAEALHASYFECSPLLGRGVQELFAHASSVLQAADEIRPTASPVSPPPSVTRNLLNLVRGRRSFSQLQPSPRTRAGSHYVPHSASSRQTTFVELNPPVPVLNIAPGTDAAAANVLLLGPQHFKCVIHGGQSSGRKSLVHRYLHGTFEWLPEVPWMTWKAAVNVISPENERRPSLPVAGTTVPYALTISETASSRSLDSLRRSTYNGTNIFILCFAVSDYREDVMTELKQRWFEECRMFNPSIPILVVATKKDQREGTSRAWTKAQGEAFSRSIRAAGYLECSAVTGEGIEDVFQAIIRIASQSHALSRF